MRRERRFSTRGFRPYRQWAAETPYLRSLSPEARGWMERFLAEYYDCDSKLLNPALHLKKCSACASGGDCGNRPAPPLHNTVELRRELYRNQSYARTDAYSLGRVTLWEDVENLDGKTRTVAHSRTHTQWLTEEGDEPAHLNLRSARKRRP